MAVTALVGQRQTQLSSKVVSCKFPEGARRWQRAVENTAEVTLRPL